MSNNKLRAITMMYATMGMFAQDPNFEGGGIPQRKSPQPKPKKKVIPKGAKVFNMGGHEIIAISEKSAIKKAEKKGYI